MTEELKQPELLRLADWLDKLDVRTPDKIMNCALAAKELRRLHALTQRPAAQTEREAFERWATNDGAWPNNIARSIESPDEYASNEIQQAWLAVQAATTPSSLPAPQQATPEPERITVQEAWEAAGGNPGIKASKADLMEALRQLDKVCDEATPEPLEQGLREIWQECRKLKGTTDGRKHVEAHALADWIMAKVSRLREAATPEPVGERATVPLDALHAVERERDYWRTRARAMLDHAEGTCWYWMGDGEDHLESLVNSLPVVIRADQLRELLARPAPGVPEKLPSAYATSTEDGTWRVLLAFDNKDDAEATRRFLHDHGVQPRTMRSSAPGVPEDSELLDYLDTLATRAAGSDLHCFGGRVALYVRTGIGSQIEASGAGTAREAIRAALAAAQAKGGEQ